MIDAEGTIKLYIDNVFIQFGLPDTIISDRGPQFTSNIFNGILDAIGINVAQDEHHLSPSNRWTNETL